MTTLKQGDLIKDSEGNTCKVLGICGEVVFVSYPKRHHIVCDSDTEAQLKNNGYTWDTPAWKATYGESYWHIDSIGGTHVSFWSNNEIDQARRDFLGIYQTEELAQAALLEIRRRLGK